jgi:hypothetical protein
MNAMSKGIEKVSEMTSEDSDWSLVSLLLLFPIGMAFERLKLSTQASLLEDRKHVVSPVSFFRRFPLTSLYMYTGQLVGGPETRDDHHVPGQRVR